MITVALVSDLQPIMTGRATPVSQPTIMTTDLGGATVFQPTIATTHLGGGGVTVFQPTIMTTHPGGNKGIDWKQSMRIWGIAEGEGEGIELSYRSELASNGGPGRSEDVG